MIVISVPWRTEIILPAEIIATAKTACVTQIAPEKLHVLKTSTSNAILVDDQQIAVIVLDPTCGVNSCKILTTQNVKLTCNTSVSKGMEIFGGQDAVFFPESDTINPFYISLQRLHFANGLTQILGAPIKINQYFEGEIKGLISIRGDRKSLFMRAYSYLF